MKSKRRKKRRANRARSAAHQKMVLDLRRSNAAQPHTNKASRSEGNRKAIREEVIEI